MEIGVKMNIIQWGRHTKGEMLHIVDGILLSVAHVWSEIGIVIRPRTMFTSTEVGAVYCVSKK